MNIYRLLTDEEIKLSNRNNRKARNWFRRNGYMPDASLTYDLHHKDPNLRYTDLQRYIQWNISDLICIEHSEHTRLHGFLENRSFADRSSTTKQMWEDKNSYVNSTDYKNLISEIVRKIMPKKIHHIMMNGSIGYLRVAKSGGHLNEGLFNHKTLQLNGKILIMRITLQHSENAKLTPI